MSGMERRADDAVLLCRTLGKRSRGAAGNDAGGSAITGALVLERVQKSAHRWYF